MTNKVVHLIFLALLMLSVGSCTNNAEQNSTVGTTYYIDYQNGDDQNSGNSNKTPWKTAEALKHKVLSPGDKVLFKRGVLYQGQVELTGVGEEDNRVLIGAYGEGEKPIIAANDSALFAVMIKNSSYLTIEELEIVNTGTTPMAGRTGLTVELKDFGTAHSITLRELLIRDVNGSLVKSEGAGSGILIKNSGDSIRSRFVDLLIEDNVILRCQRNAIIWYGYSDRRDWFPSLRTVVRGNYIEGVPGDGIVPIGCDSTLIEYNVMKECPDVLPISEAAAGIWPWSSDNTLIRFNEVSGHKAPWDAQGFDADWNCKNTVIEYNFSHDNYGGLALICDNGDADKESSVGNIGTEVRYNLSVNDGIRPKETRQGMFSPLLHGAGPIKGAKVYKNILHLQTKESSSIDNSIVVLDSWGGFPDSTSILQNIFVAEERAGIDLTSSTNTTFNGNIYCGDYSFSQKDAQVVDVRTSNISSEDCKKLRDTVSHYQGLLSMRSLTNGETCYFVNPEALKKLFQSF